MATSLADPATAGPEQAQSEPAGAQPEPPQDPGVGAARQRVCANCGAQMEAGQDWCLQCGAGAPGSLGGSGAPWRSGATVLVAAVVLALGAGAAAYAALSKGKPRP